MPLVEGDGGVRINVDVEGHGPPIVLHTGGGGDLEMWRQAGYVEGLGGSRLVLMDHRGHGRSDRPREPDQHRLECYVDDVLRVLDALGIDRADFIGYSDGAVVGYAVAATHPDRVGALIGIGAIGGEDESMADRLATAEAARRDGMAGLVAALATDERDPIPDWFVRQMLDTDPEMFALEHEGWADAPSPWSAFPLIRAPVLLIVGSEEEGPTGAAARHAGEAMARVGSGRVVVLPGVGHVAAFVRSDLVLPHITSFIDEVRAG